MTETLEDVLKYFLGDPPTYQGFPVDLSCLREDKVKGLLLPGAPSKPRTV